MGNYMLKHRVATASLVAVCGLLGLLVSVPAAQATDASVSPDLVTNNPKCSDFGLTVIAKFDPVNSGTQGGVTLTKHDTYYVKWTSTVAVDWVIVKGGPDANIYKYPVDTFGDDWLHAPMNGDRPYGLSHVEFCGDGIDEPGPKPGISVVKNGPASAYVGDQVTFTFTVTNIGGVALTNPVVVDDKCAPLTRALGEVDMSFGPGDVWSYTCTTTITGAMGDALKNTVEACAMDGDEEVCDEDDHTTKIPKPAIALDKTGAATAAAGSTFTYSFTATNTGNVTLTNVQLTDPKCQSALTRVQPNLADPTFDKGDQWHYTCTVVAPAGPAQVDNVAKVCGDYDDAAVEKKTVCDEDPHTFTVPPPGTPPGTPPGDTPPVVTPNVVPPAATPDGGVLPESIVSGRARLRGPSGCVKQAFRARVRGRSIASVTFFVDGRKVKKVRRGGTFSLKVNPARYGLGRHKIVAVVRFTAASETKARRLPLTFRRCAQGAVAPRFTG
jgi:hypothetical protein